MNIPIGAQPTNRQHNLVLTFKSGAERLGDFIQPYPSVC